MYEAKGAARSFSLNAMLNRGVLRKNTAPWHGRA